MSVARTVAVVGAGAWGTALAIVAARAGHRVRLWARDPELAEAIRRRGENAKYLPGIALARAIAATPHLPQALEASDIVLLATPAQTLASVAGEIADYRRQAGVEGWAPVVVGCAKGIERRSGRLPAEVVAERLPGLPLAALSGPSFAVDVARGLPTAVTVAARELAIAAALAHDLSAGAFRCYASDDLAGVELGGALKNVLAIAVGAARGMRLGASAEAALVARGFAELSRLARALGARPETLAGLSGLGDLVLTCSQTQSRNFSYGVALGAGEPLEGRPLAEGVFTARIAAELALRQSVAAPIIEAVADVLERRITPREAVTRLLERPLRTETE